MDPNYRPRQRRAPSIDGFNSKPVKSPTYTKIPVRTINTPVTPIASGSSLLNKTIPARSYPANQSLLNKNIAPPKKKRSKKKIVGLSFLALIILIIGFVGWDGWQLYHKLHKLNVGNLTSSVGGTENILVAGSTNRCNLSVQNYQWGFCSDGVTGVNSDIIFIVHLDPSTHSVSLLSIPRDTFIPDARSGNQAYKIDAALYEGPTQLVAAVEQDFGIPIQHYVEVGFDGFVNIVNAIGGIKMDFPLPVYDSESYLNVQEPGCHLLNGVEALQVVRARHLQYKPASVTTNYTYYWPQEAESDIARIARTHEFLRVLASSVIAKGVSNPITDQKLIDAIAPQVQVDKGFSTSTMLELLDDFRSVSIDNVPQYTLPIATPSFGSYYYEGANMGDVVFPVDQQDQQIIDKFLGESSSTNTMTGQPLPSAQSVALNVINGSNTPDQATTVSDGLEQLGFNISSQPSSGTPVSDQAQETIVYYGSSATVGDALAVASHLSGYVIISKNASQVNSGSEVTVSTGTGTAVIGLPSGSGSSTSSSTASQAASSSTSSTSSLGTISPANEALAAWDPRSCTTNQSLVPNNSNL